MSPQISATQWEQYDRDGFLMLGQLLSPTAVATMRERISDIMQGRANVNYDNMVMQREAETGKNQPGPQTKGFKGASPNYRVIYGLEYDDLFLVYLQLPIFREVCERVYGRDKRIATYRAFIMNKPARGGSDLGWHQDRWTFLSPDPLVTIWTALDPATKANGCLQVIRGSHQRVINPADESGFITPQQAAVHCTAEATPIELAAGEVAVLHNWLLHSSATNETDLSRCGFSACYMDAATQDVRPPGARSHLYDASGYPVIFGEGALRQADTR